MADKEVRKTSRTNAGQRGDRYGDGVDFTLKRQKSQTRDQEDSQKKEEDDQQHPDGGGGSQSSTTTVASELKMKLVDIKTNEEIGKWDEEFDTKQKDFRLLEVDVDSRKKQLAAERDKLQVPDLNEEAKAPISAQILVWEKELEQLEQDLNVAKINIDFDHKALERKKKSILMSADVEKHKILLDDTSVRLDEISNCDKKHSTAAWAANAGNQPADPNEEIELRKLMEERIKLEAQMAASRAKVEEMFEKVYAKRKPPQTDPDDVCGADDLLRRLQNLKDCTIPQPYQQAATAAHTMSNVDSYSPLLDTRTFLARQVQGRDLPTFSGRIEEWPMFIAAYENSTKQCKYTNSDNQIRLLKCLREDALEIVKCSLLDPSNTPKVIEQLKMIYGRPEHIIDAMMKKVREVPVVKSDKLETYIDYGIAVSNLCSMIKCLGCVDHLYNPILLNELVKKLPPSDQLRWISWLTSDSSKTKSIGTFEEWIHIQTDMACQLCPPVPKVEETRQDRGGRGAKNRNNQVFAASDSSNSSRRSPRRDNYREKKCQMCDRQNHRVNDCRQFLPLNSDDRWKAVRVKRLCFGCLNPNHSFKDCRSKKKCGVDGCENKHHHLLHPTGKPSVSKIEEVKDERDATGPDTNPATVSCAQKDTGQRRKVFNLQMIPRKLRGPKGVINALILLDNGADVTVCEEPTTTKLGNTGERKPFTVKGFQSTTTNPNSLVVQDLEIQAMDGSWIRLKDVRTVDKLDIRSQSVKKSLITKWKHLRDLPIEPYDDDRPTLLIGSDHAALIAPLESRVGPANAPVGILTKLGWMLNGNMASSPRHGYGSILFACNNDYLHQLVKQNFAVESIGIQVSTEKPRSRQDKRAQDILDSTLRKVGDQWEVGLLWKSDQVKLPRSKDKAMLRLLQMERRMDKDPEFEEQYHAKIREYNNKGFARVLSPEEAAVETDKTNYLSHFMSRNPKKPKKLRFVFDAADKIEGLSLNDHQLQGPDKLKSLPGVLLRFRQRAVAITADIQDMFHRVRVRPEDVDAQRFLWRGKDRNRKPDVLRMEVLIFGATCSPVCAQEAKNRNALEYKDKFPEAYAAITDRHYVDDYLDSRDTPEEAKKLYHEVLDIQARGGFHLRNWMSNSTELLSEIPLELQAKSMTSMAIEESTTVECERVLGLFWRPDLDQFTFSLAFVKASVDLMRGNKIPTKRELLSLMMSIYDPLGFVTTLSIKARMIQQIVWRSEVEWDQEIPPSTHGLWNIWLRELNGVTSFYLDRCYSPIFSSAEKIQLHVFGDASEEAYGAVAYFRMEKDGRVETALVMSKAKVAPLKTLSMPRLELQAALVGARLAKFLHEEHDIEIHETIFWSDSSNVLSWIRSDGKRFQQFVAVRVGELQELTDVKHWRWLPSEENVADELTRFNTPCDWRPDSRWMKGPKFLLQSECQWPKEKPRKEITPDEEDVLEMKRSCIFVLNRDEPLIDIKKFSSFRKLVNTTAFVFRFIEKTRTRNTVKGKQVTLTEFRKAEQWWWRRVQEDCFADELRQIQKKPLAKVNRLSKLNVRQDKDGVLRVHGRIENAKDAPVEMKRPVILDPVHPYTKLLVQYIHKVCGHHGQERIVNEIRQRFHIFHVRALVKKTQRDCLKCISDRVKPISPEMGQLPDYRLEANVRPFNHTGLDYFGPIEVVVKKSRVKRYVALFTCLSVRAIHLELVNSLSTDSCIMAIRRFISRRGCPSEIHSDNGTNFRGAANELKAALAELNQDNIMNECSSRGIKWSFIPPAAPHMGGSWERMVKSTKKALGSTLQQKRLTDEVLETLLTEAEHTVNSHPLTHVPDDPEDDEALTPNHFLIGRSSNLQPAGVFNDELMGRKQWRVVQQMANHFWKRWVQEYLPTLLRRQKWNQSTKPIEFGDVVIEVNPNLPRNNWPKGIVEKCYPGQDGIIRVVDIRLANRHVYKRPVSKLCILETHRKQESTIPEQEEKTAED